MLTPEQMELRKSRLGASDMAAVMGLDPYRNALDVYMRLVGMERPRPETPQMKRGNRMEAVIADWYEEEMRQQFPRLVLVPAASIIHPSHDWLLATPDRLVHFDPEQDLLAGRGLEVKTRAFTKKGEWGEAGTDEVPHGVAIQCAVGMACLNLPEWDVAAALSLDDWRIYHLLRDSETEEAIIAAGRDFMENCVAKSEPPPLDGSEAAHRLVAALWPLAGTEIVPADEEAEEWLKALAGETETAKRVEAIISELQVRLKAKIGENAGITGAAGTVTWKMVRSSPKWAEIAKELNPPAELVKSHTGPGYRKFVPKFNS